MKRFLAFLLFSVLCSQQLLAQKVDDSLRYAESIWSMQKKAMILEQMSLTEAQKSAFWPVYESYSNAVQYLDMEYIRLINFSVDGKLSEKKSESLAENLLANELLLAKTRKQYFNKFKKALSPAQAGKFMQLDNNFRTMIRLQMQKNSPALTSSVNRIYSRN
ncbi:MAG: Spy/CpxP family protein refolding chaperone [Cyclobacteriaceae bacterium]